VPPRTAPTVIARASFFLLETVEVWVESSPAVDEDEGACEEEEEEEGEEEDEAGEEPLFTV
jgi:hypothetical protein